MQSQLDPPEYICAKFHIKSSRNHEKFTTERDREKLLLPVYEHFIVSKTRAVFREAFLAATEYLVKKTVAAKTISNEFFEVIRLGETALYAIVLHLQMLTFDVWACKLTQCFDYLSLRNWFQTEKFVFELYWIDVVNELASSPKEAHAKL